MSGRIIEVPGVLHPPGGRVPLRVDVWRCGRWAPSTLANVRSGESFTTYDGDKPCDVVYCATADARRMQDGRVVVTCDRALPPPGSIKEQPPVARTLVADACAAADVFSDDDLEAHAASTARHPASCVARVGATCVWLRDGTKIVLVRGDDCRGSAHLAVREQARVRPADVPDEQRSG